ncbi:MAG: prephenate dehydratase domain-containing protein [bacterium]|nr:prephenate dehydratase domain-containing protein [bacterium]
MRIEDLRADIDQIDEKFVELFKQRMEVAAKIAEYKKENDQPVLDKQRERRLIERVSQLAGKDFEAEARVLYNTVMSVSRSYQNKLLTRKSDLIDGIKNAIENTDKVFPERAFVACQGTEGAFSQQVCEKLFAAPNIMFFNSFEGVFAAVEKGLCSYGVLPLENSSAGSVNHIYDLMFKYNFRIVRSTRIHVDHSLLVKKGVKLDQIKEIYSHEQAINQCANFLQELEGVKVHMCENTAMAAKTVAQSERDDIAAIASGNCASIYGLEIAKGSVQNIDNNYTRFICISKKTEIYPGANKTSLMVVLEHKPGALYNVISKFHSLGINIIKLESRPIPGRDFEFMFYFDIDASVYSEKFYNILLQLESETEKFHYLGSYVEVV